MLADLTTTLRYACTFIVPKLREGAHDEISNLLHALNGGYILPGPSGAPTRGMAHVLPTGRNFYSVDPRALPTVASWQVGQGLAADLIKRYDREEGGYPESVGISIWSTSAMRTAGDVIAGGAHGAGGGAPALAAGEPSRHRDRADPAGRVGPAAD